MRCSGTSELEVTTEHKPTAALTATTVCYPQVFCFYYQVPVNHSFRFGGLELLKPWGSVVAGLPPWCGSFSHPVKSGQCMKSIILLVWGKKNANQSLLKCPLNASWPFSAKGDVSMPFMSPKGCFLCLRGELSAVNLTCHNPVRITRSLVMLMLGRGGEEIGCDTAGQAWSTWGAAVGMAERGQGEGSVCLIYPQSSRASHVPWKTGAVELKWTTHFMVHR